MERIKKVFIIMTLWLTLLIFNTYANTGTVKVSATRIRKEPNTTSEIITNIYEGDEIEIVGEEGEWLKITYKSYTGYVKKEFINVTTSGQEKNNTVNNVIEKTNTSTDENISNEINSSNNVEETPNANSNLKDIIPERVALNSTSVLRLLPSFMSRTVSSTEQGKEYDKVSELNEWIQITDGTIIGWIPKAKINNNINSVVEEPTSENNISGDVNSSTQNTVSVENKVEVANQTVENTVNTNTNTSQIATANSSENMPKSGKINVETARVRAEASSNAEIIDGLDYGNTVEIISESGDWYKIKSGNIEGYVSKRLITVSENTTSRSLTESRANEIQEDNSQIDVKQNNDLNSILQNETASAGSGNNVVNFAKQYLGYPYVSAGKTPETGFDCSGFTRYVFMQFGISLGGSAASQVGSGVEVSRDSLISGDLLLFYDEGKTKIGHTGIYIGDGNFIHAANPSRGVVIDNLNTNSYYNTRFISARRLVN